MLNTVIALVLLAAVVLVLASSLYLLANIRSFL